MVKYMRSIYAHEMDDNTLESLKIKMKEVHTSSERIEMSKKMLSSDISKFSFKPSSYLEGQGYTINVKKDIFRFPSIILLDLAIVNDVWCSSTWDVPEVLKTEHRISGSLAKSLSFLLASGCFVRLEAYLHHGGHDDRISIAKEFNKKAFEIRQTPNLANRRYFVPANLFFIICKHSIPLKDSFQHFELERALSAEYQAEISWQSQTEVLYCTGRFTQALKIIKLQLSEQNSSLSDENLSPVLDRQCSLEHMTVIADTFLRASEFHAALGVYTHLLSKDGDDSHKLRMAECFRKLTSYSQCLDTLNSLTFESAEKTYQLGMVYTLMDGKEALAEEHLVTALNSCQRCLQIPGDELPKISQEQRLSQISTSDINPKAANCLMALGDLYRRKGAHSIARLYLKKSFEIINTVYGEEAIVPALGNFLKHSGMLYSDLAEHKKARDYFLESLILFKEAYGEDHHHVYVADSLYFYAKSAQRECEYIEAENFYKDSLKIYNTIHGANHHRLARLHRRLGDTLMTENGSMEALDHHFKAFQLYGDNLMHDDNMDKNIFEKMVQVFIQIIDNVDFIGRHAEEGLYRCSSRVLALRKREDIWANVTSSEIWTALKFYSLRHIIIPRKAFDCALSLIKSTAYNDPAEQMILLCDIAKELDSTEAELCH